MAKESLQSVNRKCIFRETFTPESISRNGGEITGGVTLENGVATFDGTGYITYAGNKDLSNKSKFTIRARCSREAANKLLGLSFLTDGTHRTELILYTTGATYLNISNGANAYGSTSLINDAELHEFVIAFDGSQVGNANRVKLYIDGVNHVLNFDGTTIPALSTGVGAFYIGKVNSGNSEGSFELVEIYASALSPEEVSLLYNNKLYKGPVKDSSLVLDVDFTTGSSRNRAREYGDNLVGDSGFDGTGWWSVDTNVTIANGLCNYNTSVAGGVFRSFLTSGKTYIINFDIVSLDSGLGWYITADPAHTVFDSVGHHSFQFTTASTWFTLKSEGAVVGSIDNVIVREVLEVTESNTKYAHGIGVIPTDPSTFMELNYGSSLLYAPTDAITLEAVVRANDYPQGFINRSDLSGNFGSYALTVGSGFKVRFFVEPMGNLDTAPNKMIPGKFHHVMGTYDKNTTDRYIYVDGIAVAHDTVSDSIAQTVGDNLYTGCYYSTSPAYTLKGGLKLARVYNRTLTAEEVRQSYTYLVNRGMLNG